MLGADVGLIVLAGTGNVEVAPLAATLFNHVGMALLAGGISMEAGAIAQALTQQRGMNITTRQPASFRQIIYGCQRVGGVIIYQSTTGSKHDQYNFVIVLATHQIQAIENLYLDGRRVYWNSGTGNTTRNGYNFGGSAATSGGIDGSGTYIGPNGAHYNFGTLVYCEARFGDQAQDDVIAGLTANDGNWASGAAGSPWVGGCAYLYLKIEYDAAMFPALPEIRFTVHGKSDIYDPRTGLKAYSENPALIVADILTGPTWGLNDPTVNQAQLIVAANVCDTSTACAPTTADPLGSLTEAAFAASWHYDTSTPPGEAIKVFLDAMGGRLTRAGGQWFIWPAYWHGPTASFDENVLLEPPKWNPYRKPDELINRVNGTYIAPNYPYNVAGDLYDANGWYSGSIQNNFPFAFQPTNAPAYAEDVLHGYATDLYLNQDSGATSSYSGAVSYPAGSVVLYGSGSSQIFLAVAATTGVAPFTTTIVWNALTAYTTGAQVSFNGTQYTALTNTTGNAPDTSPSQWQASPWIPYANLLPLEMEQKAVLSVSQWQRLAKYKYLRNRLQGTGTMKMKLAAFGLEALDVCYMTFAQLGWSGYLLEVAGEPQLNLEAGEVDQEGKVVRAPFFSLTVPVADIAAAAFEWSISEELTVYDVPSVLTGAPWTPAAPTGMTLISGASTAITGADGIVTPRVLVEWTDPADAYVTQIQIQFRLNGTTPWQSGGNIAVGLGQAFVTGVVAGQAYDFQIRSLRANGATSAWLQILNYTVSLVLSIVTYTGIAVAQASLTAIALVGGTAEILIGNFTANYGGTSRACTPSPNTLTGLSQNALYWVYYIDPTFAGGAITPIATQNTADFLNKAGYILIGSIMTPNYAPLYRPTSYSDIGSQTTTAPAAAYDGNISTSAIVACQWITNSIGGGGFTYPTTTGDCIWGGFPNVTLAASATLTILVTPSDYGTGTYSMEVILHIGGTPTTLATYTGTLAQQTLTPTIPSGTNLSTVSVEIICTVTPPGSPGSGGCSAADAEMWIQ
jgi:hypothetical protein